MGKKSDRRLKEGTVKKIMILSQNLKEHRFSEQQNQWIQARERKKLMRDSKNRTIPNQHEMLIEEVKMMIETQPVRMVERNRRAVIVAVMMTIKSPTSRNQRPQTYLDQPNQSIPRHVKERSKKN